MRVSVSTNKKGNSGLLKFLKELTNYWSANNFDIKVVDSKDKADIHLIFALGDLKKHCKNIIRIDGVYYDKDRINLNNSIKKNIQLSHGVIYQSQWSKIFAENMLAVSNKNNVIIYNGVDQKKYINKRLANIWNFEKTFVSCANWRKNKRPEAIAQAFLLLKSQIKKNIGLVFIGDGEINKVKDSNIIYLGNLDYKNLVNTYQMCDFMCHICHLDACPNSVIEGLSCGLPVVCNNIGGTPEIVRDSGIVVQLDSKFNFMPISNMNIVSSSSVNLHKLKEGMLQCFNREWNIQRTDLDISVSAIQYYKFFQRILQ